MLSDDEILKILNRMPGLPDSAVVSVEVAAAHDTVSVWTVRRRYPLIKLGDRRYGVSVGYLRHRKAVVA